MTETNIIIGYFYNGFPGGLGELKRFDSLASARNSFREFIGNSWVNSENCSASLYCYMTESDWADAKDYEEIGNPFDYPDYILSVGPRGGVKQEQA